MAFHRVTRLEVRMTSLPVNMPYAIAAVDANKTAGIVMKTTTARTASSLALGPGVTL